MPSAALVAGGAAIKAFSYLAEGGMDFAKVERNVQASGDALRDISTVSKDAFSARIASEGTEDANTVMNSERGGTGGGGLPSAGGQLPPREFKNVEDLVGEVRDHNLDRVKRGLPSHADEMGGSNIHEATVRDAYQTGEHWVQENNGKDVADFYLKRDTKDVLIVPRNSEYPPTCYRINMDRRDIDSVDEYMKNKTCRKADEL